MKTKESRFHIHDELTAPEGSLPILKGALSTGGQLSNFLGVLAGSPAVLRAYRPLEDEARRHRPVPREHHVTGGDVRAVPHRSCAAGFRLAQTGSASGC